MLGLLLVAAGRTGSFEIRRAVEGLLGAVDRSVAAMPTSMLVTGIFRDDVKGMNQAGQETEAAQSHIDEEICGTDTSSNGNWNWGEENRHNDKKKVGAAHRDVCGCVRWGVRGGPGLLLRGCNLCLYICVV